jgi:hypothetical protein
MIFFSKFTNVKFIRSEVCISKERTHLLSPLHNHGDTVSFYLTKTLRGRANQILSIKWSFILYMQVHKKKKWCNVKARICVQNKNSNRYKYIGGATVFNISLTRLQDSLINQDETQWDLVKSGRTIYDTTSHIFLNICYIFVWRRINTRCTIQFESMSCNAVCLFSQSNIINEQICYDLSHLITTDYTIFYTIIGFIFVRSCTSVVLL